MGCATEWSATPAVEVSPYDARLRMQEGATTVSEWDDPEPWGEDERPPRGNPHRQDRDEDDDLDDDWDDDDDDWDDDDDEEDWDWDDDED